MAKHPPEEKPLTAIVSRFTERTAGKVRFYKKLKRLRRTHEEKGQLLLNWKRRGGAEVGELGALCKSSAGAGAV